MKPAHWSRVTAKISREYGVSFKDAKFVYDRLKQTSGKTPSLRMAQALPVKLPKALWNPPKGETPKPVKPGEVFGKLPKGVKLPPPMKPPPPPGKPVKVNPKQTAKGAFQELLKKSGLPVKAIMAIPMGKELQALPDKKLQRAIVYGLKRGLKSITARGKLGKANRKTLEANFKKAFGQDFRSAWQSIMRELYGR